MKSKVITPENKAAGEIDLADERWTLDVQLEEGDLEILSRDGEDPSAEGTTGTVLGRVHVTGLLDERRCRVGRRVVHDPPGEAGLLGDEELGVVARHVDGLVRAAVVQAPRPRHVARGRVIPAARGLVGKRNARARRVLARLVRNHRVVEAPHPEEVGWGRGHSQKSGVRRPDDRDASYKYSRGSWIS